MPTVEVDVAVDGPSASDLYKQFAHDTRAGGRAAAPPDTDSDDEVASEGLHCAILCLLIICLIREFMISGLREYLAKQNVSAPVTKLAKWKTTAQILALGFLMGG